jgi:hypothetical protein
MSESIVKVKSFELAIRKMDSCKWFISERKEVCHEQAIFTLCYFYRRQNVREGVSVKSDFFFNYKLSIT